MEAASYLPHHTSAVTAAFPSQTDKTDAVSPAAALKTLPNDDIFKMGENPISIQELGGCRLSF